jgi:hypothetical protein
MYRSHLQRPNILFGLLDLTVYPERSVTNFLTTLVNIPEEGGSEEKL